MADAAAKVTATAFSVPSADHAANEDAVLLGSVAPVTDLWRPIQVTQSIDAPVLFVVADGLGGHTGGEVASRMVTAQLARRSATLSTEECVTQALDEVNRSLYDAMSARTDLVGMGSTVVGLAVGQDGIVWFNVGDSPAFVWDPPYLAQLSVDDIPAGPVTGRVTQTMGGLETFAGIDPHVGFEKARSASRFLLCSDGLTKIFGMGELEDVMDRPALLLAEVIADEAVERGRPDDCSVIIVEFESAISPGTAEVIE